MTVPMLRSALRAKSPGLSVERDLWTSGAEIVVGIDEVGRGSWAGPLTIGAVVVPKDKRVYKIRDSKMLTEDRTRGALRPHRVVVVCVGGRARIAA